jgi:hypothetical protein
MKPWKLLQSLPRATAPAALGSLVSLAAQGFLALVLFRLFSPEEVGVFSATSQLAFFWASLALAQSPLSLLAERDQEPRAAARRAWRQSAWRMLWLAPVAALGAVWSGLGQAAQVWAWAAALALTQLSWLLAQSLTLRVGSRWSMGLVRMVPPVLAAAAAVLGAVLFPVRGEGLELPVLLVSACLGYLAGAVWMRLAFQPTSAADVALAAVAGGDLPPAQPAAPTSSDPRSARLKMLHTLTDGLAATALALSWPAHYGVQEAGWMLALLRVLSFIPALVHTAWAQVVLSSDTPVRLRPIHVAFGASALVLGVGALVSAAVLWGWLDARWQGLLNCVWPLVAWQMAACFMAALAHLPFQKGLAAMYSWLCVGINAVFIALCLGGSAVFDFTASAHLGWISAFMVLSLGALALWIALSPFRHAVVPGSSKAP